MEQSLTEGLLFGVMGTALTLFIYYDNRKFNLSIGAKFGYSIFLLFFVWTIIRNLLLLYSYDLAQGTTTGTYNPIKQTSTRVRFEYYYNGKLYHSSVKNKKGIIVKGGKYYIRVVSFFPSMSEIDLSLPVERENSK